MSSTTSGIVFLISLIVALAVAYVPVGDYLYHVYNAKKHWRGERWIYRLIGAEPDAEQTWGGYVRSLLAFSLIGMLLLFALQLLQDKLPWHLPGQGVTTPTGMTAHLAFNTAASFLTNTNWQNYAGENTLGILVQMGGLTVQNFVSAAVGIAVAVAVVRGFARRKTGNLGNFWVDVTRGVVRILLPIAIILALVLIVGGCIDNFHQNTQVAHTLAGQFDPKLAGAQLNQTINGGPVASQEAIKMLGTNGGGYFNANSAHPFENPSKWTNWLEIFSMLVISFSLPRMFGRMVASTKQGLAIVSAMASLAVLSVCFMLWAQLQHHGTVPTATGSAMEGIETRFGVANSAVFGDAATLTSTGAIDSMHDSYTSFGGMVELFNMQLGEVAPGGVGSGLYGLLVLAVITVFVAGLMVGRTPEYLGKKVTPKEIKLAATYFLVTPCIVLIGTAIAMGLPGERAAMANSGPHGLSEILYAFTSAANNNGSAFAGLSANTEWYNTALGLAVLFGRFLPMIFVLAMAGAFAQQSFTPASEGTLPTHKPQFIGLVAGVTVILVALTFLPALALGPLAEGIH